MLLAFRRRWRLPGVTTRVPSWGCAARTLIARLQVCDPGLVVTVGFLIWFRLGLGVLGQFIGYVIPARRTLGTPVRPLLRRRTLWTPVPPFLDGGLAERCV